MPVRPSQNGGESKGRLLTKPTNCVTRRVFIAATRMNVGKTTTSLGLFSALRRITPNVGFIKPVGQRFVEVRGHHVDEDSHLIDRIFDVKAPIESMSPVTVDANFTRRYLTDPEGLHPQLIDKICRAFDRVSWEKDWIIVEGTGHAGVGSVFDLSNARVAKILNASVIIVAEGGIGKPVDEIALNKALFDQEGVHVLGAVLNKVQADKIEAIRPYVTAALAKLGVPLLGIFPEENTLSAPNLGQVAEEVGAQWLNARDAGIKERIHRFVIGAMAARGIIDYLEPGSLLITPGDRDDVILAAMAGASLNNGRGVAGICLTKDIMPHPRIMDMLQKSSIPVIVASHDSYTVASKIANMTIKTLPEDSDKIPLIQKIVTEHIDIQKVLAVEPASGT